MSADMPYRMVIRGFGGPEVIEREAFEPPAPGEGQLLIETEAVGLNFIDTYYRTGLYDAPLPITLGSESAGKVAAVGPGVDGFAVGDRVGSVLAGGAYTTHRIIGAAQAVRIPDGISAEEAAATMLKGFTACYLAEDILPLGPGSTALVHSAAGGVGAILVPWLRDKGVKVIAHVGSPEKATRAEADLVLTGDFAALPGPVKDASGGGVDVVFDGVGKDSWAASLACLKRRGLMVSYGNASGAVPPISLLDLMKGGSLFVTRPTMADFIATPEALAHTAQRLFDRLPRGVVPAQIGQRFALEDAAQAHAALQARKTTGSTVLLP